MRLTVLFFILLYPVLSQTLSAQTHPACLSPSSDTDGDGFGWEFNRSCVVDQSTSVAARVCVDTDGDGYGWDGFDTCTVITDGSGGAGSNNASSAVCIDSDGDGFGWDGTDTCLVEVVPPVSTQSSTALSPLECVDSDGDGFGWDGTDTCLVEPAQPVSAQSSTVSPSECIDSDGDGFGWDGTDTCLVEAVPTVSTQSSAAISTRECIDSDGDGFGWDGFDTCTVPGTSRPYDGVTDVILMMGQSNALGEDTNVDPQGLDATNNNIIAWTQFDGWQVADLCSQIWQKGWFPWRGGVCSNHPAYQIAKGIVAVDPTRKVAIIPTGIAGKPISWWDDGALAYELASEQATNALAALPGHNSVNLVAWSQGEANDGVEDVWYNKLTDLISRMRSESWMDSQETAFIAQETKNSSVNQKLPLFDSDNDSLTNWIPASDLPTKDGVHWSASALRTLGNRYAAKYLSIAK